MSEHIKIGDTAPIIAHQGDGKIKTFTYPFAIFENRDLVVYVDGEKITSGYAVTGAGTSSGGSVTFEAPPAKDSTVTLRRQIAIERTSDFQTSGILRANVLNDELDHQTAIAQQLAADIGRAIKRPISSKATGDLSFPDPVPGRTIKFGDDGGMIVSEHDPDTFAGVLPAWGLSLVGKYTSSTTVSLKGNTVYWFVLVGGGQAGTVARWGGAGGSGGGLSLYIERIERPTTAAIVIGAGGVRGRRDIRGGPGGKTSITYARKKLYANGGTNKNTHRAPHTGAPGGGGDGVLGIAGATGEAGGARIRGVPYAGGSGARGFFDGISAGWGGGHGYGADGGRGYGAGGGGTGDGGSRSRGGNGAPGVVFVWEVLR
ncbi:MAG: hypothetical protein AAF442_00010 [Pseudomonadota bacterium]